ncbi:MAG: hypothetical protein K2L17_11080 [Muribaculaceae bacterium]|nr:hypothetical protein [Muribaculaceae bacterium]
MLVQNKKKRSIKLIEFIQRAKFNILIRPYNLFSFLFLGKNYCNGRSYYPEKGKKKKVKIWIEQLIQTIKYGYPNEYYFSYGLDVKDKNERSTYLHYATFARIRDSLNMNIPSEVIILKDKFLFGMFTQYMGVTTPENIGISENTGIYDTRSKETIPTKIFLRNLHNDDLFIKPFDGQCGAGISHLIVSSDKFIINGESTSIEEVIRILESDRYILQRTVKQHEAIANLHPSSLNTLRLVTIRHQRTGKIDVFPSIIRIGTGKSFVDNTSKGGIAVGINLSNGNLNRHGFYKPEYGTKVDRHPDSLILFKDITIPYFDKCKEQAVRLHSVLPQIQSIGWDIAIGPDGPIFVEGNDRWEITGPQNCNGGLKNLFMEYLQK